MISCSNGISVSAETLQSTPENIISENDGQMEFLQISDEEVPATEIPETELNVEERNYTGTELSLSSIMPYSENDDVSNADPNYAYLVENNNAYQGSIENEKEFRWYRFEITEKSKVTVFLQMAETLDADLYMFSLDTETYSLNLVGGSATEGLGVSEHYADVLEPGIYYFAAGGYEGTGNFAFAFFNSAKDAGYEVNDTLSTATNISIGSSAVGVLDSPLDIDYYKVSVTKGYIMKYSISTTDDYSLVYAGKSGSNAAIYQVGNEDDKVLIMPGVYYFAVLSKNNMYSATSEYTVNFTKVHELSSFAMGYKAINTLDSMVGYKNDKYMDFGMVSAKTDDVANFIPARIAGGFIIPLAAMVLRLDYKGAWKIFSRDRLNHSSPNSGNSEAAFAGALGVQFGGKTSYFGKIHEKPTIGDKKKSFDLRDIMKAIKLLYVSSWVGIVFFTMITYLMDLLLKKM